MILFLGGWGEEILIQTELDRNLLKQQRLRFAECILINADHGAQRNSYGKWTDTAFYIVDNNATAAIGLQTCIDLCLIPLTFSVDDSPQSSQSGLNKESGMKEYHDLI